MTWTRFMDMHSGGGLKEFPYRNIYIEAPEAEAKVIFYNRFGHNPNRVTCTCCGGDYSITEEATFAQASAYERGCGAAYFFTGTDEQVPEDIRISLATWDKETRTHRVNGRAVDERWIERAGQDWAYRKYIPVEEYLTSEDILVIPEAEIHPEERKGSVPEQGYVWRD